MQLFSYNKICEQELNIKPNATQTFILNTCLQGYIIPKLSQVQLNHMLFWLHYSYINMCKFYRIHFLLYVS